MEIGGAGGRSNQTGVFDHRVIDRAIQAIMQHCSVNDLSGSVLLSVNDYKQETASRVHSSGRQCNLVSLPFSMGLLAARAVRSPVRLHSPGSGSVESQLTAPCMC